VSRSRLRTLVPLALPVVLSGCLIAAAGTGSSVGYVATEDRTLQQNADDVVSCTQAIELWALFNTRLNDDLSCHTYQGRMLVTGNVPSQAWRDEAIERAWRAKYVKEVYDEIAVGPSAGLVNNGQDALTTQKFIVELLTDLDVHSNNYIVTTEAGVVYILGSARNQAEAQRVIDRARALSHVERVVSFIRVDTNASSATASNPRTTPVASPDVTNQTAPPPALAPALGPVYAPPTAPTPRGDTTVTPLK
jgi:osmotically-inducible protein OsmY